LEEILKEKRKNEEDIFEQDLYLQNLFFQVSNKMATFNFETAMKLPSLTDNKETEIRDFLDSVESYHDILKEESKVILLKYVIKAKIKGKAKTRLGAEYVATTFEELTTDLRSRCGAAESFEAVRAKLLVFKQGNMSLEEYADEVNLLADKLTNLEVSRQGAGSRNYVESMTKREALLVFKKGINEKLRTVVEAAQPGNIEEALMVASTIEMPQERKFERKPVTCHHCGKIGHKKPECYALKNNKEEKPLVCYACGKAGHRSFECKNKKISTQKIRNIDEQEHLNAQGPQEEESLGGQRFSV
jgi:Retrotransposon gag protein/Zinc knuckle